MDQVRDLRARLDKSSTQPLSPRCEKMKVLTLALVIGALLLVAVPKTARHNCEDDDPLFQPL